MNNNDTTFLQKIKDNAFYVALGVGILAIIAVIAVYTMGRDGGGAYDDGEVDLNQISDYSSITTESNANENNRRERSTANYANKTNTSEENRTRSNKDAVESIPDTKAAAEMEKRNVQVSERSMEGTGEIETGSTDTVREGDASEDGEQLPVSADVLELDFSSDKTLTWPVSGEVILPYSMETTVYYKTLDQYRTNPGMLIAAGSGSTVKNAYLGKVVKVTSDNTYGNLVTIYIGNDYSVVYGQLDTIYVKEGDFIKAGESVGTIGKPTDSFEDEGSHLFFQVLKGDNPVDPMEFME